MARSSSRLSSIDLLPEEADEDIAWAHGELRAAKRHKHEILEEFNDRLAAKGIEPISRSAWYRHSVAVAEATRRIERTREITSAITERLEIGSTDDLTIAIAETMKTLVFEMLEDGGRAGWSPKQAKEMAEAVRAIVSAQKTSSDMRRRVEAEMAQRTEAAIDQVRTVQGMTEATAESIRRAILGMPEPGSTE